MVFQCNNICQVPREVLKTEASCLGFQHLPRDQSNVNAWKNMFDPYIDIVPSNPNIVKGCKLYANRVDVVRPNSLPWRNEKVRKQQVIWAGNTEKGLVSVLLLFTANW